MHSLSSFIATIHLLERSWSRQLITCEFLSIFQVLVHCAVLLYYAVRMRHSVQTMFCAVIEFSTHTLKVLWVFGSLYVETFQTPMWPYLYDIWEL